MKHEENVDVRRVSKIAKIDTQMKVIQLNTNKIGIKTLGRIDYLCNILGYRIVKSGVSINDNFDNTISNRELKKQIKEAKINNNMAKKANKKKK